MAYSAIKIPVPGNLIDTPNALNGHLLKFSEDGGVYRNFRPLVLDLSPDTGNKVLNFKVSTGTFGSYDETTQTGMFLAKGPGGNQINDFKLSINLGETEPQATLDVGGNLSVGKSTSTNYIFPDGQAPATATHKRKILNLDIDSKIKFLLLSDIAWSRDNSISITGNDIIVNPDYLADNLYGAGYGIRITGSDDGVSGGVIEADLEWLRRNNPNPPLSQYSSADGGLFHVTGGLSLTGGVLALGDITKDVRTGDGVKVESVDGKIKISADTQFLSQDKAVFSFGSGIGYTNLAASSFDVISTPWERGLEGAHYYVGFAPQSSGSSVEHARLEGHGEFPLTGGWWSTGQADGDARYYVASFKGGDTHNDMFSDDIGGIEILTQDINNDEFAIKCENLVDSSDVQWASDAGHNTTTIPLTASHHPLFYVKATSGIMYNSSHYYTEGRINIGTHGACQDADWIGGESYSNDFRRGGADLFNIPAHISIASESPSVLLHQTSTGTNPQICLTNMNSTNKNAWGTSGGTNNAWTTIANRDSSILSIETSTQYGGNIYNPNSTDTSENRLSIANRAHVWSLDYYQSGDSSSDPDYVYMRMGASGVTG